VISSLIVSFQAYHTTSSSDGAKFRDGIPHHQGMPHGRLYPAIAACNMTFQTKDVNRHLADLETVEASLGQRLILDIYLMPLCGR
jgi:hypothetical protein